METKNKSGYEIRLEVLRMAMEIENSRWSWENDAVRYKADRTNSHELTVPADDRVEKAIKVAETLYKFIEKK
jgi:hypothetical protein